MTPEEIMAKIEWCGKEVWEKGNLDAPDRFYAPDVLYHRPPLPDIVGLAAQKANVASFREACSDIRLAFHDWAAGEGKIVYRWTLSMRHTGQSAVMPLAATGKELTLIGCTFDYLKDGQIVEEIEYSDHLGFFRQLGLVPAHG